MKFIRSLFNRQSSTFVKSSDLAKMIAPVHMQALLDHNPKTLAHGFSELTEWTRIGFDAESNKGTFYEALNIALRSLTTTLENATPVTGRDGQPGIYVRHDDLRVLRAGSVQIYEAARNLRHIAETMRPGPAIYDVKDQDGNRRRIMDFSQTIPIYNRPNGNHGLAADQIEDCLKNIDAFFGKSSVRPANDATMRQYAAVQKLLR